jgi:hypothetical protein
MTHWGLLRQKKKCREKYDNVKGAQISTHVALYPFSIIIAVLVLMHKNVCKVTRIE